MIYFISPLETTYQPRGLRVTKLIEHVFACCDLTIITSNFDHQDKKFIRASSIVSGNQHKTIVLSSIAYRRNLSVLRLAFQVWFSIKLLIFLILRVKKEDKVVVMGSFPELYATVALAKYFKKFTTLLDVWDTWPEALPLKLSSLTSTLFIRYCKTLNCFSLKSFDVVFYVAPSFERWLLTNGVNPDKFRYLPLGFDEKRWQISKRASVVYDYVYVGYLSYQFDLRPFIRAFSGVPKTLCIIGDGENVEEYRNLAHGNKHISFLGALKKDEVVSILRSSSVALLPLADHSAAEMPNKLFDYIGAGLPILCAGGTDAGQLVKKHNFGWHCKNNAKQISDTLSGITDEEIDLKRKNLISKRDDFSTATLYSNLEI